MSLCTALLIGKNPKHIVEQLHQCCKSGSLKTLYVKIISELDLDDKNISLSLGINRHRFHQGIVSCYRSLESSNVDVRILLTNYRDTEWRKVTTSKLIETVYYDPLFPISAVENFINDNVCNKTANYRIIPCLEVQDHNNSNSSSEDDMDELKCYNSVVLGGTFDKLHAGHKLLFSEAILRCQKQLTVGVVSDDMLQNKLLCELIDDCRTRIQIVKEFLQDIDQSLQYNVVEINDMYGPTKTDPSFEMIVTSTETRKGAEKINEYRKQAGLNELDIIEIDVIDCDKVSTYEDVKISSSNTRMRLLGTLIKAPYPRPHLPRRPYIIGLTGSIASGKSTVMNYLEDLGCGCVNCDELGHRAYEIGSSGYNFIKNTFGSEVLNEDGSVNRKQLGAVVFNDQKKLAQLNQGLWPLILEKAKQKIEEMQDKDVVVMEAALLIQADWISQCHEIWSCIIPPEEAVKRLQERNHYSVQEAQTRVNAQLGNKYYVAHANVILCSFWDHNYTKKQLEKAWAGLQKRLSLANTS